MSAILLEINSFISVKISVMNEKVYLNLTKPDLDHAQDALSCGAGFHLQRKYYQAIIEQISPSLDRNEILQ